MITKEYISIIPKDALVAEIENRIKKYTLLQQKPEMSDLQKELQDKIDCLNSIKGYILNTIEVKEVDLEKEAERFVQTKEFIESTESPVILVAKHFFELGLKAQNKDYE